MFKRVLSIFSAVAALCAGAVLIASPAQAAAASTQFRIMFVGSAIPSWAKCAEVYVYSDQSVHCVRGLVPGRDSNTGIIASVPDGSAPDSKERRIRVSLFDIQKCHGDFRSQGWWEAPGVAQLGVNNWWIDFS